MNQKHADLLVIGGGVLGAFHAYHATQRGLRTILLERDTAPRGATVRNFGQVVPSGMDPKWQRYGRDSLEIYKTIQNQCDISLRQQGSIYIASDDEELQLIEELRAINRAEDYQSELWSRDRCLAAYPQLRSDYCVGGLFFPEEVSVNPRMMIHRLHDYLASQPNVEIRFQSPVSGLAVRSNSVIAETTRGESFSAEKVVLCCGSEFATLFPEVFTASDLQAVGLQMLRLKPQPHVLLKGNILTGSTIRRYESFAQCPSWSSVKAREPADSFAKRWGIHILFKQEVDGGIILGDSHEYAPASGGDRLGNVIRQDINDFFIREARQIFNLSGWEVETSWYGIYSQTGEASGIFTKTIDDRIHIVTGIGGKGMTSGAGFAKHYLAGIFND